MRTEAGDRWRDRIQFEIGIRFDMVPASSMTWRQWAFEPMVNFVRVGDVLPNPRANLPKFGPGFVDEIGGDERDPETGLRKFIWVSRCFWMSGAIRILGFDLGVGIFYRQRFDAPNPHRHTTTPADTTS